MLGKERRAIYKKNSMLASFKWIIENEINKVKDSLNLEKKVKEAEKVDNQLKLISVKRNKKNLKVDHKNTIVKEVQSRKKDAF